MHFIFSRGGEEEAMCESREREWLGGGCGEEGGDSLEGSLRGHSRNILYPETLSKGPWVPNTTITSTTL
jgi:hypothetical protein